MVRQNRVLKVMNCMLVRRFPNEDFDLRRVIGALAEGHERSKRKDGSRTLQPSGGAKPRRRCYSISPVLLPSDIKLGGVGYRHNSHDTRLNRIADYQVGSIGDTA